MTIIYHSKDLDGWCSAAIGKKKWPDATLIGYDYGDPLPEIPNDDVIVVDVSMPMKLMGTLASKSKSFIWIDHHKSAIEEYEKLFPSRRFPSLLKIGVAACELMWSYCFPNSPVPKPVQLLGAYDVWRNEDLVYWGTQVVPFQYGMRSICGSAETFPMQALSDEFNTEDVIKYGVGVLAFTSNENRNLSKYAFTKKVGKYTAVCLNTNRFSSMTFDYAYQADKHDLMLPFMWDGRLWRCSLYTTKDIDVSAIAKQYGGGGHAKAAGFTFGGNLDQLWELLAD